MADFKVGELVQHENGAMGIIYPFNKYDTWHTSYEVGVRWLDYPYPENNYHYADKTKLKRVEPKWRV